MNKRIRRKLEKQAELTRSDALSGSAWGRVSLSFEKLEDALDDFVHTVGAELRGLDTTLLGGVRARVQAFDRDVGPQLARLPVVGPQVARSVHQFSAAV